MPKDVNLGDDDGWMTVTIGECTITLDVWETNNRIYQHHQANKDKDELAYGQGLADLVNSLGFGSVSRRMAQRFADAVQKRVKELSGNS